MEIIKYKNLEAVLFENESTRIIVIPGLGGKIVSYFDKNKEFELIYQNDSQEYKIPKVGKRFQDFDMSGFDDCFPNIEKGFESYYPDHGEIWSSSFNYEIIDDLLILDFESNLLPYKYTKTITLNENIVNIGYSIKNYGEQDIRGFFTAHFLTNMEEGSEIILPNSVKKIVSVMDSSTLGCKNSVHSFPKSKDTKGEDLFINLIKGPNEKKCEKFYVLGDLNSGICGISYPSIQSYFVMDFNYEQLPYLGVWINENGFNNNYNCALEPSNGFYDSIDCAKKNNRLLTLKGSENFEFNVKFYLSENISLFV